MAEGTKDAPEMSFEEVGRVVDRSSRRGRPFRFALAWSLDFADMAAAWRSRHGAEREFLPKNHEAGFRVALAEANYGRTLNPDGSSYAPATWQDHEVELAVLSLQYSATLALIVSDPASSAEQPFAAKCFRDGKVYDWSNSNLPGGCYGVMDVSSGQPVMKWREARGNLVAWPEWPTVLDALVPRSPRPCPHPPEVEAAPA